MAAKKYNKTKNAISKVEEPVNRLTFFTSLEAMSEADIEDVNRFDSIEHLKNATALIQRAFKTALNAEPIDKKIHFK